MVLADLGRKITSALQSLSKATVINEEVSTCSQKSREKTTDNAVRSASESSSFLVKYQHDVSRKPQKSTNLWRFFFV